LPFSRFTNAYVTWVRMYTEDSKYMAWRANIDRPPVGQPRSRAADQQEGAAFMQFLGAVGGD